MRHGAKGEGIDAAEPFGSSAAAFADVPRPSGATSKPAAEAAPTAAVQVLQWLKTAAQNGCTAAIELAVARGLPAQCASAHATASGPSPL